MYSSTIDLLFNCFSLIYLDQKTKNVIKRGVRHWRKTLKGCLKFIRLDRDPEFEKSISREKFGGGNVHHILFTKTNGGYGNYFLIFNLFHCP